LSDTAPLCCAWQPPEDPRPPPPPVAVAMATTPPPPPPAPLLGVVVVVVSARLWTRWGPRVASKQQEHRAQVRQRFHFFVDFKPKHYDHFFLPRQARDKHGESTTLKRRFTVFLQLQGKYQRPSQTTRRRTAPRRHTHSKQRRRRKKKKRRRRRRTKSARCVLVCPIVFFLRFVSRPSRACLGKTSGVPVPERACLGKTAV
jgi:hypothetical protein